jgi:hypothetical protein
MKGTIIGTDLLEFNNSVKILEINTNTTIFNSAVDLLDYTSFFEMLVNNDINELHFIYNEKDSYVSDDNNINYTFLFEERLKTKCIENNITYFDYKVPANSVTVPYIEDASNKFILRQAFDTTALVDETYCADKFEFFNLMKDSEYIPKTYINDGTELSFDTFNTISNYTNGRPNLVKKDRYPSYDFHLYPALSKLTTDAQLSQLKTSVDNTTFLIQEFIYDDSNIVNNRWNVIRSIDILYGNELDVLNMGSYRTSAFVDVDAWEDEYKGDGTTLTKKSRYRWVNKPVYNITTDFNYHTNGESLILSSTGTLMSLNDLEVGNPIASINFMNEDGLSPNSYDSDNIKLRTPPSRWNSTISQAQSTLTNTPSDVLSITSETLSEIMLKITLENGVSWNEFRDTQYLIQAANSSVTYFDRLNTVEIGDKMVTYNKTTSELSTLTITGIEIVYDEVIGYNIDIEPSDLFLVDITTDLFAIQHNVDCGNCGWYECGQIGCNYQCAYCNAQTLPPKT